MAQNVRKKRDSLYTAKHRLRFEGLILHMFIELAGVAIQACITQKLKKQHLKRFFWIFFLMKKVSNWGLKILFWTPSLHMPYCHWAICVLLIKGGRRGSWRDGSISKVLARQVWGEEFKSPAPVWKAFLERQRQEELADQMVSMKTRSRRMRQH